MFRKSTYDQVGGYRASFYFAQDCDLWSRMIDCSDVMVIESTLTGGIFSAQGISGKYAHEQKQLLALILQGREQRLSGKSDVETLNLAVELRPSRINKTRTLNQSSNNFDGLYFVAKVLTDNKSEHALVYWRKALKSRPFSMKSWLFATSSFVHLMIHRTKSLLGV